jgi:hypothetical protein
MWHKSLYSAGEGLSMRAGRGGADGGMGEWGNAECGMRDG